MQLEAVSERDWRCTRRPISSRLRDAIGGQDRMNSDMQLESEDGASLEMHMEAEIE